MVRIVETTVYRRNSRLSLTAIAPELGHVDLTWGIFPTWIPGNHFLALRANESHHLRDEIRIREMDLIRTDVEIRDFRE